MHQYRVTITVDVEATTPDRAERQAFAAIDGAARARDSPEVRSILAKVERVDRLGSS